MSLLDSLSALILGDPSAEGLQGRVTTYEELHADVQNILIPATLPRGVSVRVLQPLNKHFALTHRMLLETGKPAANPFAAMMGGASEEAKDEFGRPKTYRHYALGAVLSGGTSQAPGARWRVASSLDNDLRSHSTAMVDARGDGRLVLSAQLLDRRLDAAGPHWGAAAVLRGVDYAASLRAKHGPELGLSYHQRLAPGSPVSLGGEMLFSTPAMRGALQGAAGAAGGADAAAAAKPLEWSAGAAYDAGTSKSALHVDFTGGRSRTVSAHHLYRLTERSSLAAKFIADTRSLNSMAAAGYRLRFRNTASVITGEVDTYGKVRLLVEREPVKDLRVALSAEANVHGGGGANAFGLQISVGNQAALPRQLSPITISRDVFNPM